MTAVELLEPFLRRAHDRCDDIAESAQFLVLKADQVRRVVEYRQPARAEIVFGKQAGGLKFFAPEADNQRRAAEVGVHADIV